MPVWIHARTNQWRYKEPILPPYPTIPNSLLDQQIGEILSQNEILNNEADSDSEVPSDSRSQETRSVPVSINYDTAPKGVNSEVELAKRRVLEKQKDRIRTKYNV